MLEFEKSEALRIAERHAAAERGYRQYVAASFGLEDEMRDARNLRDRVTDVERRVNILERAGASQVELSDATPNPGLNQLTGAIDQGYRDLPENIRRDAEQSIRREQRSREWSRDSISF